MEDKQHKVPIGIAQNIKQLKSAYETNKRKRKRGTDDFDAIAAAFKRIKNILRQAVEKKFALSKEFDFSLGSAEEKGLAAKAEFRRVDFNKDLDEKNYVGALIWLSTLRPDVDAFFDHVMVMVEDEQLRANRLALLQKLLNDFSTIADFSEIVTDKRGS